MPSCLGCDCTPSLPVPGLVFLAGLAELVNGIARLNHSLVAIDIYDGRGEDKVSIREIRMTEGRARQVFPRPQLLVTAGDHAVHNRPILKYHQWLAHSLFALPFQASCDQMPSSSDYRTR
jgi:hypothetical protein